MSFTFLLKQQETIESQLNPIFEYLKNKKSLKTDLASL